MPGVLQRKVVLSGYSVYRRICPPQHLLHIAVDLQNYKYDEQLFTFHHMIHETVGPSIGITLATHPRGMALISFTWHPTLTCTLYKYKLPCPHIASRQMSTDQLWSYLELFYHSPSDII